MFENAAILERERADNFLYSGHRSVLFLGLILVSEPKLTLWYWLRFHNDVPLTFSHALPDCHLLLPARTPPMYHRKPMSFIPFYPLHSAYHSPNLPIRHQCLFNPQYPSIRLLVFAVSAPSLQMLLETFVSCIIQPIGTKILGWPWGWGEAPTLTGVAETTVSLIVSSHVNIEKLCIYTPSQLLAPVPQEHLHSRWRLTSSLFIRVLVYSESEGI